MARTQEEELQKLVRAQLQQDRRDAANATTRSPFHREVGGTISPTSPITTVDLTQSGSRQAAHPVPTTGPSVRDLSSEYAGPNNGGFMAQTLDAGQGLFNAARQMTPSAIGGRFFDQALHGMSGESDLAREELSGTIPSGIWNSMSNEQKNQMARGVVKDRNAAPNTKAVGDAFGQSTGSGYGYGGAGGANAGGTTANVGPQGDAVSRLQAARQPRGLTFSNLFGSTGFDPETGQFTTTESPEYAQFQQGLLGQLQGAQSAYQSFNPQDAAAEYLQGVNAIREPLRQGQTQSALSRLVQSGKLGATAGTQAMAQLESAQENQRFQEGVQAQQYGQQQQQQMLANQAGLFGLASQVAQQQFQPQQQALGAVPLLQEIYSFPEEPAFQQSLAQQALDAQRSANNTGMFGSIFGAIAPHIFG